MDENYPTDAKQPAQPTGMALIGTTIRNEFATRDAPAVVQIHAVFDGIDSRGIQEQMNTHYDHDRMKMSRLNETDDECLVPTSPSLHSHSTGSRSPIKADSVNSTTSASSQITAIQTSHNYYNNENGSGSQPEGSNYYSGAGDDDRKLMIGGGKTVSSDELNAETKDHEILKETINSSNRLRSNSMPYISRESESSPLLSSKTLRRGKWTQEEEAFVARAINDFNCGFLNVPAGTTLRTYLSDKLQCNPMRVTKKFTGDSCIGKRVFHPAVRNESNAAAIDQAQVRDNGPCMFCIQK